MILKTVYASTVYVDETTGRIIDREELRNLSYTSRLEQNEEIKYIVTGKQIGRANV